MTKDMPELTVLIENVNPELRDMLAKAYNAGFRAGRIDAARHFSREAEVLLNEAEFQPASSKPLQTNHAALQWNFERLNEHRGLRFDTPIGVFVQSLELDEYRTQSLLEKFEREGVSTVRDLLLQETVTSCSATIQRKLAEFEYTLLDDHAPDINFDTHV